MRVLVISEPCPLRAEVLEVLARGPHEVRLLADDAIETSRKWTGRIEPFAPPVVSSEALAQVCMGCQAVIQLTVPTRRCPYGHELCLDSDRLRQRVDVCDRLGVRRFVSLSAAAAMDELIEAEDTIARFPHEWLIVRPGVVYGHGDALVWPLLTLMRRLPSLPQSAGTGRRLQPLWLGDLAEIAVRTLALPVDLTRRTLRVAGPTMVTEAELYDHVRRVVGGEPADIDVPEAALRMIGEALAWHEDAPYDAEAAATVTQTFGVTPTPLTAGLQMLIAESSQEIAMSRTDTTPDGR